MVYPYSKVHGANMGHHLGPAGPRWAQCWPHELCYLGKHIGNKSAFRLIWYNSCGMSKLALCDFWNGSCESVNHQSSFTIASSGTMQTDATAIMICALSHADDTQSLIMMTSSNGNIFRVTGHLCGEFTAHRCIHCTTASDAELWYFRWSEPE